jgi:hypothetical protein
MLFALVTDVMLFALVTEGRRRGNYLLAASAARAIATVMPDNPGL